MALTRMILVTRSIGNLSNTRMIILSMMACYILALRQSLDYSFLFLRAYNLTFWMFITALYLVLIVALDLSWIGSAINVTSWVWHHVWKILSMPVYCVIREKKGIFSPTYLLQPIQWEYQFSRVSMDTCGPMPLSEIGMKYIATFKCSYTKSVIVKPIPNTEAATITKILIEDVIM